jgi:hypothetical protein
MGITPRREKEQRRSAPGKLSGIGPIHRRGPRSREAGRTLRRQSVPKDAKSNAKLGR